MNVALEALSSSELEHTQGDALRNSEQNSNWEAKWGAEVSAMPKGDGGWSSRPAKSGGLGKHPRLLAGMVEKLF